MSLPVNISGSRAAAVLGLSKYQTQVEVWAQICEARRPGFCAERGYVLPVFEGNYQTRMGQAFEAAILDKLADINKTGIEAEQEFYEKDFMTCHIDGILDGNLAEAKTTNLYSYNSEWGDVESGNIPQGYQIQVQHNMLLSGLKKCLLPVLVFPVPQTEYEKAGVIPEEIDTYKWIDTLHEMGALKIYTIDANPKLQKLMVKKYKKFWNDHVLTEIEPPVMDADDIKILCPEPVGTIIMTETAERLAKEYADINREIGTGGTLAKRKDQIRKDLLTYFYECKKAMKLPIDDDSTDRWIFRNESGDKLGSFDGKTFRVSSGKD